MQSWLWVNGRFGWPIIGALVFVTLSLLVGDLAWRTFNLKFDIFLFYAAAGTASLGVIVLGIHLLRLRS